MEIAITKKVFTTVDFDVPDDVTDAVLSKKIKELVEKMDLDDWDIYDWRGKEVYEAYDTYSGSEIELDF
jgi:Txe/YoeB family toxin of Txe-Axe toxin-antitoxin module